MILPAVNAMLTPRHGLRFPWDSRARFFRASGLEWVRSQDQIPFLACFEDAFVLPHAETFLMQAATSHPERLAQYDIVETLAQGPSGWVFYKGFDPILRRNATLRAIPKRQLENYGTAMIARLKGDVISASRLRHPGIVGVYEFGEDAEWVFIAMENVEGSCLKERGRIPIADAVSLIEQVLGALEVAHNQGIVHRDIKPSNLLITNKGIARVANFGTAELSPGTPEYMSPEQLTGAVVDRRSDLFSLGIVFYELLTGAAAFPGPAETLVQRVCNDKQRPPSEINTDLPQTLDLVCAKALAKATPERYQNARSFSEALRDAFENAFAASPGRTVSNETMMTSTFPRPQAEPDFGAAPKARDLKPLLPPMAGRFDEATLRTVEKQLANFMGPLARIIVKEAASKSADLEQLYKVASESLKQEDDRRAFLSQRAVASPGNGKSESGKVPAPGVHSARPAAHDPAQRSAAPPSVPKATPVPKPPSPPPKSVPAQNIHAPIKGVPADKVAATPVAQVRPTPVTPPAPKQEVQAGAKPEVVPTHKPAKPPAAPVLSAPDPAARFEKLVGKQPETLAGYLREGPPQLEEVIHAFVSSVQAVIAMHATGNKKEALTPQSICFDRLGKATVQTLQPTLTRGTSSGAGNPRYAAPEIFSEKSSGSDSTLAGAHVYALGVIFYEILLGQRLFHKTFAGQRTDLDWLRWQADLESRAPQLKSLLPDYPVALSDLVESMMEKRAEKRTTDLEAILTKMRSIAQRANKTVVLGKTGAKQPALKPSSKASPSPRKKGNTGWLILLVFIIAAAGIGVFAWQNPDAFRTLIAPLLNLLNR